jgi:tetratricopeptide (TPR) repeat protein
VELPSRTALKSEHPELARQLRGDLDAILCRALDRDPALRYASAIDMQEDLQRYLERRPVKARAATPLYRVGKFVRRNTLAVGLVGLMMVGVVVAGTVMAIQSHRTALARDMAARRAEFIETLLASADPGSGKPSLTVPALLDSAAEDLDRKLGGEPLVEASMLGLIARTNSSLGRFPEGLAASDRELVILRAVGGSDLEMGRALSTRGQLLREQGKWPEALPPLQKAVSLLRKQRSPMDLCRALDTLGVVLAHSNQEKAAEGIYQEEIALEAVADAELRAQRVHPLYALTVLMGELGRYAEAATYGKQAMALAQETLPETNPDYLSIKVAYADTLESTQKSVEAEPLLREVMATQTRILGAQHKATLLTGLALVNNLLDQHRDADAAAAALPLARSLETALGADNLYTLSAWNQYGNAACNSHSEKEGLQALRLVEAARQRIYPAGSWPISSTALAIGTCLYKARQFAEAESTLLAAVSGLEASRGPSFNRTQDGYRVLRDFYTTLGRPDQAATWGAKLPH